MWGKLIALQRSEVAKIPATLKSVSEVWLAIIISIMHTITLVITSKLLNIK